MEKTECANTLTLTFPLGHTHTYTRTGTPKRTQSRNDSNGKLTGPCAQAQLRPSTQADGWPIHEDAGTGA